VFHEALGQREAGSKSVRAASAVPPIRFRSKFARAPQALAIRWLITAARGRNETRWKSVWPGELLDAANNRGNAVKKREDTHRMAEANRAFSHYRW
jgi:small subunit ribosomal protein S7